MRKQEYIHVHALFLEVTRYLRDREGWSPERPIEYEALDTRPSCVYKSKRHHHDAVMALASDMEPWLKQELSEMPEVSVALSR